MGTTAQTQSGQAAGCGCLVLFGLLLIGLCTGGGGGSDSSSSPPVAYPPADRPSAVERTAAEPREGVYIHGTLNVRAAPRREAEILRTLERGDYVQMGPMDANGWAPVYSGGSPSGYAYRASEAVQLSAPVVESAPDRTYSRSSAESRVYIRGPKGGCYYINRNKNKQYVDRSMCN
jgi:hypothetical protein